MARQHYKKLWLTSLTPEMHARTCGYWYTVTEAGTPHTAFRTRGGLLTWLHDRGLRVDAIIPNPGVYSSHDIIGEYRRDEHMVTVEEFEVLEGYETRTLSNGDYTKAVITCDGDGIRTVHTLNCNVRDRVKYDYQESNAMMS